MALTARAAAKKSTNRTAPPARKRGRSWSRIHASVITPRMPSEPMNRRSGLGPAPEPGRRRVSTRPRSHDAWFSTKSSMACRSCKRPRPGRVDRPMSCIQALRKNAAGSRAWSFSCASSVGPKTPASMRAPRGVRSISTPGRGTQVENAARRREMPSGARRPATAAGAERDQRVRRLLNRRRQSLASSRG